jgi:hypothetical protein
MKRIGLACIIAPAAVLLAMLPTFAKTEQGLKGAWESTDLDGSFQQLTISGNKDNYHIRYMSLCDCVWWGPRQWRGSRRGGR